MHRAGQSPAAADCHMLYAMNASVDDDRGFFGHPRGLSTLFFTEMWERFSYYGMRAFLILYMVTPVASGGLGFSDPDAASIYGTYTGSVWGAAILGGIIADRFLGQYRSVLIGGIIIALGHFTLAFKALPFFYSGLTLIVIGTGLLKPNVSTVVGSLYAPGDTRRDAGFSIFYMGINLGAFLGPLIAGYLAQRVDWHLGFACAGVGMALGVAQYILGRKRLLAGDRTHGGAADGDRCEERSRGLGPCPTRRRSGLLDRRVEAHRRHLHSLSRRVALLGRVRTSRLHADAVRGTLHATGDHGILVPVILVSNRAAYLRDSVRSAVRVALDAARSTGAIGANQVRAGPVVHGAVVSGARPGRCDGPGGRGCSSQPMVARDRPTRSPSSASSVSARSVSAR